LRIGVGDQLEAEKHVAGFEKHPVEIVDVLARRVQADGVLLGLEQQRLRHSTADLPGDGKVGVAFIHAVIERCAVLPLAVFPLVRNVGSLGERGRLGEAACNHCGGAERPTALPVCGTSS
jgi:hypothetical protein